MKRVKFVFDIANLTRSITRKTDAGPLRKAEGSSVTSSNLYDRFIFYNHLSMFCLFVQNIIIVESTFGGRRSWVSSEL